MPFDPVSYSEVSANLRSHKVKDRSLGLDSLKTHFRRASNLDRVNRWEDVFNDLFACVSLEKQACKGKGAATAEKRLQQTAEHVRWLVEVSVKCWKKFRDLEYVVEQLMKSAKKDQSTALESLRAIKIIIHYPPHQQTLPHEQERDLLSLCFKTVLGSSASHAKVESDADELESDRSVGSKRGAATPPIAPLKRHRPRNTLSAEQQEAIQIISQLLKTTHDFLLPQILRSSPDSQESMIVDTDDDYPAEVLRNLSLCLSLLPSDHTLNNEFLAAISSALSHLALNRTQDVINFAHRSWEDLLSIWGTKNKFLKEGLVDVLHRLLPYRIPHTGFSCGRVKENWIEGINRLWRLLERTRWGSDHLSFHAIRLELSPLSEDENRARRGSDPFVRSTFRAGMNFSSGQALSWAVLQLRADCAAILFNFHESHLQNVTSPAQPRKKRSVDHPLTSLLVSVQQATEPLTRVYNLQTLLFVIDKHWAILHDTMQEEVIDVLVALLAGDHPELLVWSFLCLGAITYCDCRASSASNALPPVAHYHGHAKRKAARWDPIWLHALRRVNVPIVCRAACHVAHSLLFYHRVNARASFSSPVTHSRMLSEIESFAKDLDVQGPPYPSDSVCIFLARCLQIASQDARLYRMHLEDKALVWLLQSWKGVGVSDREGLPLVMLQDILYLLETICGFRRRSDLICLITLPNCLITNTLVDEATVQVIRDFQLDAKLSSFDKHHTLSDPWADDFEGGDTEVGSLNQAGPRERNVFSFLIRRLEDHISEWNNVKDIVSLRVERVRAFLDSAVISLLFHALMSVNGSRLDSSAPLVSQALKLMVSIVRSLATGTWNATETALILTSLQPLVTIEDLKPDECIPMLAPDDGTGIRADVLHRLQSLQNLDIHAKGSARRRRLLRRVWRNVNDALQTMLQTMGLLLDILMTGDIVHDFASQGSNDTESSAFPGNVPVIHADNHFAVSYGPYDPSIQCIARVTVGFLVVIPLLQSTSDEPHYSATLMKQFRKGIGTPERFLAIFPSLLTHIRYNTFAITEQDFDDLVTVLSTWLRKTYNTREDDHCFLTVIDFLVATLPLYINVDRWSDNLRSLHEYLRWGLGSDDGIFRTWQIRKALLSLFSLHANLRPDFARFVDDGEDTLDRNKRPALFPGALIPLGHQDCDIRVRFRACVEGARLYSVARRCGHEELHVYAVARQCLTSQLGNYEFMLTRILYLGNAMITSSAVRRGPYWHLLEICLQPDHPFVHQVTAVLSAVSERMGFSTLSVLFETYASQVAFSIYSAGLSYFSLPPEVAGYRNRAEYTRAAFRPFTPALLLRDENHLTSTGSAQNAFVQHCEMLGKSGQDGIQEIFGDVVAYELLESITETGGRGIMDVLVQKTVRQDASDFVHHLKSRLDAVIVSILQCLGELDVSRSGPVESAIAATTPNSTPSFRALTAYSAVVRLHEPNPPTYSAKSVIRALNWVLETAGQTDRTAISYHVLQELFAALHASPLVNEQLRMITAISLWCALNSDIFGSRSLLYALMHGSASVFSQPDIARPAQSLLEWTFGRYRTGPIVDTRFPEILLRVCNQSYSFSQDNDDSIRRLGLDLLDWIEQQATLLCASATRYIRRQVLTCLPAWPRELPDSLSIHVQGLTSQSLSNDLNDLSASKDRFRLARRLCVQDDLTSDDFAQTVFWRLKESIPTVDQIQEDDILAFAELLTAKSGAVSSFGPNQLRISRSSLQRSQDLSPDVLILSSLLSVIHSQSHTRLYAAYKALRSVMPILSALPGDHKWPFEEREILMLSQQYSPVLEEQIASSIEDLAGDHFSTSNDFSQWISRLAICLANVLSFSHRWYAQLRPLLGSDSHLCESVLPGLVAVVLRDDKSGARRNGLSQYFTTILRAGTTEVPCLRAIIDVVLYLRHQERIRGAPLSGNTWLDLDYKLLAEKAILCGAYTTALLFLELATDYSKDASDTVGVENVMYEIYSNIDEPDGFYGIRDNDYERFLIRRLHHENQWEKAFHFHGASYEASSSSPSQAEGVLESFHAFGFNQLALQTLQASSAQMMSSSKAYHLGWRTESWDLPLQDSSRHSGEAIYMALRAQHRDRDPGVVKEVIRRVLRTEMEYLRRLGSENISQIRDVVQSLMCLGQIARWNPSKMTAIVNTGEHREDLNKFTSLSFDFDFPDAEAIVATRISLLRSLRNVEGRNRIGSLMSPLDEALADVEKQCLLSLSKASRASGQKQAALNAVSRARGLELISSFQISRELANVFWMHGEHIQAVQLMSGLLDEKSASALQNAEMKAQLGEWTSQACLQTSTHIIQSYFNPASTSIQPKGQKDTPMPADPSGNENGPSLRASIFHKYAVFSENRYRAILASPEPARRKMYLDRSSRLVEESRRRQSGQNMIKINQQKEHDEEAYRQIVGERDESLKTAIQMYAQALIQSDDYDNDASIHLCSLWLANFDSTEKEFTRAIKKSLSGVPSRKFVFLSHQLTARLSASASSDEHTNQTTLQRLILRMCQEHPFHTLYQVISLIQETSRTPATDATSRSAADRRNAAKMAYSKLVVEKPVAKDMNDLAKVCLLWATYDIKSTKHDPGKQYPIPAAVKITAITNSSAPVMTCHTPIDLSMHYDDYVKVSGFESTYSVAGGINMPKITTCLGSDGQRYKQLFKGANDDLRQDAVMEQVFDLVNKTLWQDSETRKRRLSIRDYAVIPLSSTQGAGVLEFVGDTVAIKEWLADSTTIYLSDKNAYTKAYNEYFALCNRQRHTKEEQIAAFDRIVQKYPPIMRHYFTEKQRTPMGWFAMRLNYTRSVATTSVVGYMLGIGDRHLSNILWDTTSGEVIHIDLGVAFDQGRYLKLPEIVPFRMTPNMVDGMGMTGVEGVFRRCAEETLRVLRDQSSLIMSVLEVFRHDPLHTWVSKDKLRKIQEQDAPADSTTSKNENAVYVALGLGIAIDMNSGSAQEQADRSLTLVKERLDKTLSVAATISNLISEATDRHNLSRMYHGWGPYL